MSKRGQHLRNLGLYSGGNWPEYRHGTITVAGQAVPVKSRITLAGPKPKPILRGEKRRSAIGQTMDLLRDWRQSPFEHEAASRHGLRSALCVEGHGWDRSDAEAAAIVGEGLRLLGAVRPSYAEGQWEYSVSPDYCAKCHGPIDEADRAKGFRFCSETCAGMAYELRAYREVRKEYDLARNAYVVIKTAEAPELTCQYCKRPFRRMGADRESRKAEGKDKFCSVACQRASMVVYADRECRQCGNMFRPRSERQFLCSKACMGRNNVKGPNRICKTCSKGFRYYRAASDPNGGLYCSKPCVNAGKGNVAIDRTCEWCYSPYVAKGAKSRFCGPRCRQRSVDIRNGTWKPKRLTAPVFDHFLTRPIDDYRQRLITPHRLDWMFLERGLRITEEVKIAA